MLITRHRTARTLVGCAQLEHIATEPVLAVPESGRRIATIGVQQIPGEDVGRLRPCEDSLPRRQR